MLEALRWAPGPKRRSLTPRAARVLSAADRQDDVLNRDLDDLVSLAGHVRGRGRIRTLDGLAASG